MSKVYNHKMENRHPLLQLFVFVSFFSLNLVAETLRLGVLSPRPVEITQERWQPLAEYLSEALPDHEIELIAANYLELDQLVTQGELDFVLTNPSHYIHIRYHQELSGALATLMVEDQGHALTGFGGVIFTLATSDIHQLSDVSGKNLAAVATDSLGGYQAQAYELLQENIKIPQDLNNLFLTGMPHDQAVQAVLDGRADVGFVRTGILEAMAAENAIDLDQLRIINSDRVQHFPLLISTRLYPEWPFIALARVDSSISRKIAGALLLLSNTSPVAEAAQVQGFSIPADYAPVEDLARALRLPPYDQEVQLSLADIWEHWRNLALTLLTVVASVLLIGSLYLLYINRRLARSYTEISAMAKRVNHLAYFDTLTGLSNRAFLHEQLDKIFQQNHSQMKHTSNLLVFINLDRFKVLNLARGNNFGDQLLKAVAEELQQTTKALVLPATASQQVARLNADEFAVLLAFDRKLSSHQEWKLGEQVAERLKERFSQPLELEGEALNLSARMASSYFPDSPQDSTEAVVRRVNTALDMARRQGGGCFVFFETPMGEQAIEHFEIEKTLSQAIRNHELCLHLQPQVTSEGQLKAAEALVRWEHPQKGLLSPGLFIPVAEESNLVVEIGCWVVTEALRLIQVARKRGLDFEMSINISARHFHQKNFVDWLKDQVYAAEINPKYLTLEITESLIIDNIDEVVEKMRELRRFGLKFSIDDFGTGYSSLSYLKHLPIHEIKIDKSFVQDVSTDPDSAALVETILAVAEKMQLQVVAEGVETQEQLEFLASKAKILYQGYYFSKPQPGEAWINNL
ncbi:diguanylate cyclase (GGDEF) domain-containing protein [Marinospirillum celere]|uniref:Diguanylate cyclase (GGDEF) domain-containing protein n=1 Tax=Marinospirillum celere TaxID=1122252 RepID=A0A1I1ENC3_9GAMM|nr:EAL domain-containing protein [Marinospirillum celere]SFB88152.1 diguanylate cyclase (GGDEF) domain-containing protein [Marinospirillum celere]